MIPIMKGIMKKVEAAFESGGFGQAIGVLFKELSTTVLPLFLKFFTMMLDGVIKALPVIIPFIAEAFVAVVNGLIEFSSDFIEAFISLIDALLEAGILESILGAFVDVILALLPLIPTILEDIVTVFIKVIKGLIKFLPDLIKAFIKVIVALIPLVPKLITALMPIFELIVKAIGTAIISVIKGALGMTGGGKKHKAEGVYASPDMGGTTTFSDFISRPGQSAVGFSPDDTIIGMKDLSKLGGGNIEININNPIVSKSSDIKMLANEVSRVLQRQMTGRVSSSI